MSKDLEIEIEKLRQDRDRALAMFESITDALTKVAERLNEANHGFRAYEKVDKTTGVAWDTGIASPGQWAALLAENAPVRDLTGPIDADLAGRIAAAVGKSIDVRAGTA